MEISECLILVTIIDVDAVPVMDQFDTQVGW